MLKSLAEKIHIFGRGGEFCFRIPGEGGFQNSQINLEIEFYTKKKKTPRKTKKYRYNWSIINSYPNSAEDEATRYRPDPTEPTFA